MTLTSQTSFHHPVFTSEVYKMDALVFLVLVFVVLSLIYYFVTYNNDYWEKKGVPYIRSKPAIIEIIHDLTTDKSFAEIFKKLYDSEEFSGSPYGGIFMGGQPNLVLKDPDLIKTVMIKDFQHFSDRGIAINEDKHPLQAHLFSLSGWRWRSLRTKLTPTFTSGKMKMMFDLMVECSQLMCKSLNSKAEAGEIIEMKEELAKFTTDVIGSCAFGIQFNTMNNPDNEFRKMGRQIFENSFRGSVLRILRRYCPKLWSILGLSTFSTESQSYFVKMVKETVKTREQQGIHRNDFLQLLIDIKNKKKIESVEEIDEIQQKFLDEDNKVYEITDKVLAAQAFVFFLAGFETSSTTMSFALHELALNPDVQDKLAEEIHQVLRSHNGKLSYESIQDMKYLDQVVSETLRKFSPAQLLTRRCTKRYTFEDTNLTIEKDTLVHIPVYGLHYDPKYYPEPEKFNPNRFSASEKSKLHPCVYLPFGEGPRNCIGMRFGLLQSKLGLASLINEYKFEICEKSTVPTKLLSRSFVASIKGGVWLQIKKR